MGGVNLLFDVYGLEVAIFITLYIYHTFFYRLNIFDIYNHNTEFMIFKEEKYSQNMFL